MEGILHVYHPSRNLNLFEILPYSASNNDRQFPQPPENVLLFIGGLFDTFSAPSYVSNLAALFPISQKQIWRVMHIQLSSTLRGWGIFDLNRDIQEIAVGVKYIRESLFGEKTNIVIMGHSTGCQDVMHYLTAANEPARPVVQGAILQAPVSDREAVLNDLVKSPTLTAQYDRCLELISNTLESQHRTAILPMNLTTALYGPAPISMSRFLSLVSPTSPEHPSMDDFFSSDLSDDTFRRTFGIIGCEQPGLLKPSNMQKPNLLVLISGSDNGVPPHVDTADLLNRWKNALATSGVLLDKASNTIPNAVHDISGDDPANQRARMIVMRQAVLEYLNRVVGRISEESWTIFGDDRREIEKQESKL